MIVRRILTDHEISEAASIHEEAFPGFFLTTLGTSFLKIYYRSVSKHQKGILLGYFNKYNELCGFCAATVMSKGFNKEIIKKNLVQFLWVSLRLLFSRPASLIRLINNFTKKSSTVTDDAEYAELLSVAVAVNNQRQGIGEELLLQLENELKKEKCKDLSLTTDYFDNDKAIAFYKKIGYKPLYEFISYPNRKMYRMVKKLN